MAKHVSMGKIKRLTARAARRYGIKYSVLMGLMEQESSFDIGAVSSVGAFGLTQFMPATAAQYGVKRNNAKSQIFGAAKYLRDLGGTHNIALALGHYYGDPSSPYASEVLAKARRYRGTAPRLDGTGGAAGGVRVPAQYTGPRTRTVEQFIPPPPPTLQLENRLAPDVPGTQAATTRAPQPGDSLSSQIQTPAEYAHSVSRLGDLTAFQGRIETRQVPLPRPPASLRKSAAYTLPGGSSAGGSQVVKWAQAVLGTREGSARQVKWASTLGLSASLPWCSIFVAYGLRKQGVSLPSNPAYSGSWLDWSGGKRVRGGIKSARPGDLLIFDWGDGGITDHIGIYIGHGKYIAGNDSNNSVGKGSVPTGNIVGIVRPRYGKKRRKR